jgi:hypothetical protein
MYLIPDGTTARIAHPAGRGADPDRRTTSGTLDSLPARSSSAFERKV